MSVPYDSITITPVLGPEEDFACFKKRYGDHNTYWFDLGCYDFSIESLTREFPNITFFGYVCHAYSGMPDWATCQNIVFNRWGITHLGKEYETSYLSIEHPKIVDLKVFGFVPDEPDDNVE